MTPRTMESSCKLFHFRRIAFHEFDEEAEGVLNAGIFERAQEIKNAFDIAARGGLRFDVTGGGDLARVGEKLDCVWIEHAGIDDDAAGVDQLSEFGGNASVDHFVAGVEKRGNSAARVRTFSTSTLEASLRRSPMLSPMLSVMMLPRRKNSSAALTAKAMRSILLSTSFNDSMTGGIGELFEQAGIEECAKFGFVHGVGDLDSGAGELRKFAGDIHEFVGGTAVPGIDDHFVHGVGDFVAAADEAVQGVGAEGEQFGAIQEAVEGVKNFGVGESGLQLFLRRGGGGAVGGGHGLARSCWKAYREMERFAMASTCYTPG